MTNHNISAVENDSTARTCIDAAKQRAENLSILGYKNVLELCVGPSLRSLESCYKSYGISVTGNDLEYRWKQYYPQGKWLIGDCFKVNYTLFDCIVFAPPLSHGCTGRREDSLSINQVVPKYVDFIKHIIQQNKAFTLVLPGRSTATRNDREQFHALLSTLRGLGCHWHTEELRAGSRKILKYVDIYVEKK